MRFRIFCDVCSEWCIPAMRYLDYVVCEKCTPLFPGTFKDRNDFKKHLEQVKIDLKQKNKTLH